MSITFSFNFFLCTFLLLLSFSSSQELNRTNITITKEETVYTSNHTGNWHFYDADVKEVINSSFIKVKVLCESIDNYARVYISSQIDEPNYKNSDYKSINPGGIIMIPGRYFLNENKIIIAIEVKNPSSKYNLTIHGTNDISLEKNMDIEMIFDSMSETSFIYDPKEQVKDSIMFSAIGPNVMDIEMIIQYGTKSYTSLRLFDNGRGVVIPSADFTYQEGSVFTITVICDMSTLLQVGVKHIPIDSTIDNHIRMLSYNVIIIDNKADSIKQVCYTIDSIDESPSKNETRHYIVNAKSFTQNAHFYIYDKSSSKEIQGVDIISSNYMTFDYKKDYQLCIKASSGYSNEVSAQFQILDMEYITEYQPYKEPLIRGITHEEMVPKGKVMYYRIPSLAPFSNEIEMNIHFIKGYPKLYKGYCDDYPNCTIKPEDIAHLESIGEISTTYDINENIYLKAQVKGDEIYKSPIQTIAIVYCPDDPLENVVDCVFDISLECPGDTTSLLPETRYTRPIEFGDSDMYSFEITDASVNKLYVVLYSYSGNADLYVASSPYFEEEVGTYYADGNREYIVIDKGGSSSLVGQYYAKVEAMKNAYYTIFYYTETAEQKIFEVPSGEMFMETINMNEKKTFYLTNRNIENNVPYLASIHSINCDLKVNFNNTKYTQRFTQVVIDETDPMYKDAKYKFDIEFVKFDSNSTSQDERCLFYLAGDESFQDNELLLNEGVFHQMAFNYKINYISYIYPFVYSGPSQIVFSINKYSTLNLKINYKFYGREGSQGIINNHHRKIEILISEIEEHCSIGEPCPLIIEIEPEKKITDRHTELRFQIEVLSSAGIPSYLTLGEIRYNRLNGKKTNLLSLPNVHYYYSDLAQGTSGEINIDFLRGSGNAVAKVVRKDVIESDPDWNRRVQLPTQDSDGIKRLDYYDKRIEISEDDTSDCPKGCEIYVEVYTDNIYSEDKIVEYSIVLRRNDTVSNLPLQEIVSNTLYETIHKDVYNYFQTHIYENTNRIVFDVDCDLCVVFVNYGTNKPDKSHYDWMFDSNVRYFMIYEDDPKLNGSTLNGTTFTIAVGASVIDGISGSYYNMKVIAPPRSVQIVHEINSAHDELCLITENNGKCYFIIPIHAGYGGNDIHVYALNEGINVTRVEIFSKFIDTQDYHKYSPEVLILNFPNDKYYEHSSINEEMSALLSIPVKKRDVDRYLALTIQGTKPAELRILTTFYKTPRSTDFLAHCNELFALKAGSQLDLILGGFHVYYTEIVVIQGQLTMAYDKNNLKANLTTLDSEDVSTLGNIIDPKRLFVHHYIEATSKYPITIFFVRYTAVTDQGHFTKLKYGRINNLHYNDMNPFPIEYYATIKDDNTDLLINVHLNQLVKSDTFASSDDFNVRGYIVDESWIIERKGNSSLVPHTWDVESTYDQSLQLARFKFDRRDYSSLNTNFKYIYIKIDQNYDNYHTYNKVVSTVSILPVNVNLINVPHNVYYYGEMDRYKSREVLSFTKSNVKHVLMDIEYSMWNRDEFDFTLNPVDKFEPNINYYKNSSYIDIVEVVNNGGRTIITVDASVFHEIHFALLRKSYSDTQRYKDYFTVKYRSSDNYLPHFIIDKPDIIIEKKRNLANIGVAFPKHSNNQFLLLNTRFTLKLYWYSNYKSEKELETFNPENEPLYVFTNFNKIGNSFVYFNDTPIYPRDYYVTVEAVGIDSSTSELMLYNVAVLKNKPPNDNITLWVILAFIVVVIISGIIVGVYIYKINRKKSEDTSSNTPINIVEG